MPTRTGVAPAALERVELILPIADGTNGSFGIFPAIDEFQTVSIRLELLVEIFDRISYLHGSKIPPCYMTSRDSYSKNRTQRSPATRIQLIVTYLTHNS